MRVLLLLGVMLAALSLTVAADPIVTYQPTGACGDSGCAGPGVTATAFVGGDTPSLPTGFFRTENGWVADPSFPTGFSVNSGFTFGFDAVSGGYMDSISIEEHNNICEGHCTDGIGSDWSVYEEVNGGPAALLGTFTTGDPAFQENTFTFNVNQSFNSGDSVEFLAVTTAIDPGVIGTSVDLFDLAEVDGPASEGSVPEPGSLLLLGSGLVAVAGRTRRRQLSR